MERSSAAANGPTALDWPLDRGWRVSGPSGTRTGVAVPDAVARQSWRDWDPSSWEAEWSYHTTFDLPDPVRDTRTHRYFLRFAGALTAISPTVNGHQLPVHTGGYLPAEYEITPLVRPRGNRLDVVLDGRFDVDVPPNNPGKPSSSVDFAQLAGLYREVTVRAVPRDHIADVHAAPRHVLDPARRAVDVTVRVDAPTPAPDTRLRVALTDDNRTLAITDTPVATPGTPTITAGLTRLGAVELWSPEHPKRYALRVALVRDDTPVHEYITWIGFRQAEFTTRGFFLNGEHRTLFGLNRHQIFPYVGGAMPPRVQRRDARILKDLNCTMVRCSHYPQHEAFLDACDELGILVYEEAPGWGSLGDDAWREAVRRDVRAMILRDRNRPSVVLWGVRLNETPPDPELYADTQRIAAELDPTRQTTGALASTDYDTTSFEQDVFSYNDYNARTVGGTRTPRLNPPRPDRPTLVTESVGTLSGPGRFYRRTDPVTDQHGQALAHALVHDQAGADPRYCGALGWAGFDYASWTGNQYRGVKYPGVLDQFREPKPGAAVYAAQRDSSAGVVIEPAFYWDFTGRFSVRELGDDALIFANADRLELFVDERRHAVLRPDRARFPHLRYAPFRADFGSLDEGELRIEAYAGARHLGTRRFSADHAQDRLTVTVDDPAIAADGVDATRVVLRVTDRYGNNRPGRAGAVRLETSGPGELIGDNPFPLGETGGVAAVWVRGLPGRPGRFTITARHDVFPPARVGVTIAG